MHTVFSFPLGNKWTVKYQYFEAIAFQTCIMTWHSWYRWRARIDGGLMIMLRLPGPTDLRIPPIYLDKLCPQTYKYGNKEKLLDAAWNNHLRKRNGNTCIRWRARLMIKLRLPGPTPMRLLAPKYLTKLRSQTYKYWNIRYLKYSSEKKKRLYMHSATGSNRW